MYETLGTLVTENHLNSMTEEISECCPLIYDINYENTYTKLRIHTLSYVVTNVMWSIWRGKDLLKDTIHSVLMCLLPWSVSCVETGYE